ncbi:uncharacterized protein LOC118753679 [Rhagoletis pomonella]|uniref:uncharacterized protein LOC118753679 n=1 Tax=Rhagoletis pomonella TaxID=28610 RepID=UPI00177F51FA|nr:uncharacterized protein LOC118753679 [Rhagoletis pomonella]
MAWIISVTPLPDRPRQRYARKRHTLLFQGSTRSKRISLYLHCPIQPQYGSFKLTPLTVKKRRRMQPARILILIRFLYSQQRTTIPSQRHQLQNRHQIMQSLCSA